MQWGKLQGQTLQSTSEYWAAKHRLLTRGYSNICHPFQLHPDSTALVDPNFLPKDFGPFLSNNYESLWFSASPILWFNFKNFDNILYLANSNARS